MKKYLVFYGYVYYPEGGMNDFHGDFDTIEECNNFMDNNMGLGMWSHIYNTKTKEII